MKTFLKSGTLKNRATLSAALALALTATISLTACQVEDSENDWTVDQTDGSQGLLVEGRDACIAQLMKADKTQAEAEKLCNQATPSQYHSNGGHSNGMLWYLIGRNSGRVSSYEGHPSTGLAYRGGYRDAYTPTNVRSNNMHASHSSYHGSTSRGGMSHGHGVGGHGG